MVYFQKRIAKKGGKKMTDSVKRIVIGVVVLIAVLVFGIYGCNAYKSVPAGHVGVKVHLLGGQKGVDNETVPVGRIWIGMNEELYLYPTYIQQYRFTQGKDGDSPTDEAFYFQNKDGVKCNVDLAVEAFANPEKVSILFQKYRQGLGTVIHVNIRNSIHNKVQSAASSMSTEELYSSKKVELVKKIEEDIKKEFEPYGISIIKISLLSDIRFPKVVEDAIVAKIQATQEALQRENEIQKAKADATIKVTNAKAEAETIRLQAQNQTQANIQAEAIKKWDGKLPVYMMGNSVPFINLKAGQ
jgi:regulator of protease activity HflC (stomatin/prohibitin superfamily)